MTENALFRDAQEGIDGLPAEAAAAMVGSVSRKRVDSAPEHPDGDRKLGKIDVGA